MAKLEICLVRHADALDADGRLVTSDAQRPLSGAGQLQARLLGKALAASGWHPDLLLHSPLVRTTQTANFMLEGAKKLSMHWKSEPFAPLASGAGIRMVLSGLEKANHKGKLVLVGHMPEVSELAGWFLGADPANLHFPKAGAMLISCPLGLAEGMASLKWFTDSAWHELAD